MSFSSLLRGTILQDGRGEERKNKREKGNRKIFFSNKKAPSPPPYAANLKIT